ncbi:MAG: B12-binding domain-containing protein [Anaerolineaceae bacterium]
MASILDYSTEAKYNIKAVTQRTDIQEVTIRAWERRYGLLEPQRASNGYRLYSERDIAILNWVKKQLGSGLSISSVAGEFTHGITNNIWPEAVISDKGPVPSRMGTEQDIEIMTHQFTQALMRIDERMASDILSEILGFVNLIHLFEWVLIPALVEIGALWERGKISVAVEHFASNLIQGKIQAIYHSLPLHAYAPKVMVGCAPDELHEIGSLMFATLLRDAGYRVEYLGPDVPLKDLAVYAGEEKPKILVISSTIQESAQLLAKFSIQLEKLAPRPIFGFGGAAFNRNPGLIKQTSGVYLGKSLPESLANVRSLVPLRRSPN